MKNFVVLFLAMSFVVAGPMARAEKMDSETQNDVISRLERVLSKMEKGEAPWTATNMRGPVP